MQRATLSDGRQLRSEAVHLDDSPEGVRTVDPSRHSDSHLGRICSIAIASPQLTPVAPGTFCSATKLPAYCRWLNKLRVSLSSIIPIDIITSTKKTVNVDRFYNTDRLRPKFESFEMTPLFIMTSDAA